MSETQYLPGRLGFSDEADIDEFVAMLARYESGELSSDAWRAFRLVRGVYGQRQPDTQMLRVKVPQGVLTAAQLTALAQVAERYGNGRCAVTTRQNLQFHHIRLANVEHAMRELAETGLTTREACGNSVRTVTACPLAGVDAEEIFDVTPYADAFTRHFLRGPLSSTLPRKFKVAFEGCHRGCVRAPINDLAFVARRSESGEPGFLVLCGGGLATLARSGAVLQEFLPAAEILSISEAVLRLFHRLGNRANKHKARLKWVIEKLGFEEFKKQVLVEWEEVKASGAPELPFSPDAAPVEPVPERGLLRLSLSSEAMTSAQRAELATWRRRNVIVQRQDGYIAVVLALPLGALRGDQLRSIAELAIEYSDGTARTTVEQNLVLRHVAESRVAALYKHLQAAELAQPGAGDFRDVVSCPGADTCAIAVTASRSMGRTLHEHLRSLPEDPGLQDARIHLSGCPNGCGQHHLGTLGFQGGLRKIGGRPLPVYHLSIGGGLEEGGTRARFTRLVGKLPVRRGPAAVDRLLALWRQDRKDPSETLAAYYASVPVDKVRAALADLFEISEETADAADYVDIGQEAPFIVAEGESECAA